MITAIHKEKELFSKEFNEFCSLGIQISECQSKLEVLRKRSNSEETQKIKLETAVQKFIDYQPYLDELHKRFSYRSVDEILQEITIVEDK